MKHHSGNPLKGETLSDYSDTTLIITDTAKYEVSSDLIRISPNRQRKIMEEQAVVIPLVPHPRELLIPRYSVCSVNRLITEMVFLGKSDEECTFRIPYFTFLTYGTARKLAAAITERAGLPVRLIRRRQLPTGASQDSPWESSFREGNRLRIAFLFGSWLVPLFGGFMVAYAHPSAIHVIQLGFVLLLLQMIGRLLAFNLGQARQGLSLRLLALKLANAVTFSLIYVMAVVFGLIIFHPR